MRDAAVHHAAEAVVGAHVLAGHSRDLEMTEAVDDLSVLGDLRLERVDWEEPVVPILLDEAVPA